MRLFFISIFIALSSSVAWGQIPTISLPSSFTPPPPPNPGAIPNPGSLQYQAFVNNLLVPQLQGPPSAGYIKADNTLLVPVLVKANSTDSSLLPKSYESSIQGLQFIKPSPFNQNKKRISQ